MTINDLNARLKQMEIMISESDARLKRMEVLANIDSNSTVREKVGVKREAKIISCKTHSYRGFLRSSFTVSLLERTMYTSKKAAKVVKIAGALFEQTVLKCRSNELLDVALSRNPVWGTLAHDVDYTFCLLGSPSNPISISGVKTSDDVTWLHLVSVIEVEFSVKPRTNTEISLDLEFLDSSLVNSDCTLLVEGHRFSASKGEKDQDEVKLEGVIAAEFAILLKAMYQPITNKNALLAGSTVECLLRLADYFQVQVVTKRCSDFLKTCSITVVDMGEKLQLAQDYNFLMSWTSVSSNAEPCLT
uniref:BTB domain-containing protein n=1 Tax=Ditylenchus dipsaci TaxID=166011 RepID=A0A915EKR2_9BILA